MSTPAPLTPTSIDRIVSLHHQAVAANADTYIDPATGYKVFTSSALSRRRCCGNACRHCPYDYRAVKNPAFISPINVQIRERQRQLHPVSLSAPSPPASPRSPPSPPTPPPEVEEEVQQQGGEGTVGRGGA